MFAAGTETALNWPATGATIVPEVRSVPGWFVELFAYSPATTLVAVEPVSTNTRSWVTEPLAVAVVLNASARPGAFESSFASTVWLPARNVAARCRLGNGEGAAGERAVSTPPNGCGAA